MLPSRGRPLKSMLVLSHAGELDATDVERLRYLPRAARSQPAPTLQTIRSSHHIAARLLASGKTAIEVAKSIGRTPQRIRDLQKDPAFNGLVRYYEDNISEAMLEEAVEVQGVLKDVARSALEEIQERLDDPAKRAAIPTSELRQLAGDALSRTIAPQKTAQPSVPVPTQITFKIGTRDLTPRDITIEAGQDGPQNPDSQSPISLPLLEHEEPVS